MKCCFTWVEEVLTTLIMILINSLEYRALYCGPIKNGTYFLLETLLIGDFARVPLEKGESLMGNS